MPAGDLCTVEDVRSFLQKQDADSEQDLILAALIGRASVAIMRYTEREFAPAGDPGVARKFELCDEWYDTILSLAPYDLQTATAVKLDTDLASAVTLTAEEYRLMPRPARDGVYNRIRLRPQTASSSTWFGDIREVEITGTWGFPAVPEDVRHAAVVTVADWFRRDVAAFSTTFNLDTGALDVPQAVPRSVLPVLDAYRRMGY